MLNAPAVTTAGLTKRYGARAAVDALDLQVPAGQVVGFVGPNGAGKTTTIRMLLGLVRPAAGTGTVLGHPLTEPAAYLPRVGALIETPAFYPGLSGRRNLEVLAALAGTDRSRIPLVLEQVGLAGRAGDAFRRYSLGMKQRLGIACALLGDPRLLILDEPTNGLDPAGIREIRELLQALAAQGVSVLMSSHLLAEVEQACSWLILINGGRRVFQGPTVELLTGASRRLVLVPERPADLTRLAAVADALHLQSEQQEQGRLVVTVSGDSADTTVVGLAAELNRRAMGEGVVLVELHADRAGLEERYLTLTSAGAP